MDTSTHVITGVGIAGLSFIDPTIAIHPELLTSVVLCTVVGSNAPDIDFLYKYKGNDIYVQKHRGVTHSLYAQILLAFTIAGVATLANGLMFFTTFFLWSLIAVMGHVLLDTFNIYGTQSFRPFSQKWYAFNLLPIFDPFIMILHIVGILLWIKGFPSDVTFSFVYLFISLYILLRYFIQRKVIHYLLRQCEPCVQIILIPTFRLTHWTVISSSANEYKLGKYVNKGVIWSKVLMKACEKNEVISASRRNDFIHYLINRFSYIHANIIHQTDGYEVHWFDLRYQSKIDEPFIAIIKLDKKLNLVKSNVKRGLILAPERA